MIEDTPEDSAIHAVESIVHWKALRESLERTIGDLESDLAAFRWELSVGFEEHPTERRHERLLRLRRLYAKLASRERLAAWELGSPAQPLRKGRLRSRSSAPPA